MNDEQKPTKENERGWKNRILHKIPYDLWLVAYALRYISAINKSKSNQQFSIVFSRYFLVGLMIEWLRGFSIDAVVFNYHKIWGCRMCVSVCTCTPVISNGNFNFNWMMLMINDKMPSHSWRHTRNAERIKWTNGYRCFMVYGTMHTVHIKFGIPNVTWRDWIRR